MKGLLQRLAERAAGSAPALRSDARLPWRGGAAPWPPADAALPTAFAPPPLVDDAAPAALPPGAAPQRPQPRQAVPGTGLQDAAGRAAGPLAAADTGPAALLDDGPRPWSSAEASAPHQRALDLPSPTAWPQPQRLSAAAWPQAPAAAAPALEPVLPRAVADGAAHAGTGRDGPWAAAGLSTHARAGVAEPAPLLPPRPGGHAAAVAAVAASLPAPRPAGEAAPRAAAAAEPSEVHVHIGRIEVTALPEAPGPRRAPRQRTAPVTLEAYLAARGKAS